jgi:hypothetical protein
VCFTDALKLSMATTEYFHSAVTLTIWRRMPPLSFSKPAIRPPAWSDLHKKNMTPVL